MMVSKMRAAILVEQHKPLVVAEVELPEKLSFGQVLVKVQYSGICGSQLNEIDGVKGVDPYLPHLLGHEGSGIVLETGEGVSTVKEGDHVVLHWRKGNGLQSLTPVYRWNGRKVNAGWVTTFNEYAVVSENRVTPIPEDFSLELGVLFGCAVTTAFGVLNNDAGVKIGQSVVVFGAGGVGLNIIQGARMVSAYPVVAVDRVGIKIEMARRFGATHTLRADKDLEKQIGGIVGTEGADVVIDTTGDTRVIELAYEVTHPDGKTILVGVPKKECKASIYTLPLHFRKVLTGSHGGNAIPHEDIPRYVRLHKAGLLNLEGLITHRFSLEKINEAIDLMRQGNVGRSVIAFEDE